MGHQIQKPEKTFDFGGGKTKDKSLSSLDGLSFGQNKTKRQGSL